MEHELFTIVIDVLTSELTDIAISLGVENYAMEKVITDECDVQVTLAFPTAVDAERYRKALAAAP